MLPASRIISYPDKLLLVQSISSRCLNEKRCFVYETFRDVHKNVFKQVYVWSLLNKNIDLVYNI